MLRRFPLLALVFIASCVVAEPDVVVNPGTCPTVGNQPTGLEFTTDQELAELPEVTPPEVPNLPPKVDLSNRMPPPGDQGNQGSCVGWATAYAMKSHQENVAGGSFQNAAGAVDTDRVFSPAFIYNQINGGRDGGAKTPHAMRLMMKIGSATWSQMPYRDDNYSEQPSGTVLAHAAHYKIVAYGRTRAKDVNEIKSYLFSDFPVVIGANVDAAFTALPAGQVWDRTDGPTGGHAMTVVGYDDDRQAFKILNSWGADWSDRGFGWIQYPQFLRAVREAFIAFKTLPKDPAKEPTIHPPKKPAEKPEDKPVTTTTPPGVEITIVRVSAKERYRESSKFGWWVTAEGSMRLPAGVGARAQVLTRFYRDSGAGTKGALLSLTAVSNPDGIVSAQSASYDIPAEGLGREWRTRTPHSAFDLPAATPVKLLAEPVLFVDGKELASGKPYPFELIPQ